MTNHTCDCLNDCGDDPDIKKGKVTPCDYYRRRLEALKERSDALQSVKELLSIARQHGRVEVVVEQLELIAKHFK